jgi:hypothetical protein
VQTRDRKERLGLTKQPQATRRRDQRAIFRRPTRRTPAAASSAASVNSSDLDSAGAGASVTGLHVPALPGRLQASPEPVQLWLQHTPCAQNPDEHCDGAVQLSPSPRPLGVAVGVTVPVALAVGVDAGVPVGVTVRVGVPVGVFV